MYTIPSEREKLNLTEAMRRNVSTFVRNAFNIPMPKGAFNRLLMSSLSADGSKIEPSSDAWNDFIHEILEDYPRKVKYWHHDPKMVFRTYQQDMKELGIIVPDINPRMSKANYREEMRKMVSANIPLLKEIFSNEINSLMELILFGQVDDLGLSDDVEVVDDVIKHLRKLYVGDNFINDVKCLALRYKALETLQPLPSLQGKVPEKVYNLFPEDAIEAFASPFNAQFKRYCSKFDIDGLFGSMGSFFDLDLQNELVIANPPFTNTILTMMVNKIEASPSNSFICIVPRWEDAEWFIRLKKLASETLQLEGEKHRYEIRGMKAWSSFKMRPSTVMFAINTSIPESVSKAFR